MRALCGALGFVGPDAGARAWMARACAELDADRLMLVIPGSAGLLMHVRNTKRRQGGGASARIERVLDGRPVFCSNQTLFGLAPDGVQLQRVEFRDGSTGEVAVRHNTYLIDDPSWSRD